jgi:hypothetical protein
MSYKKLFISLNVIGNKIVTLQKKEYFLNNYNHGRSWCKIWQIKS